MSNKGCGSALSVTSTLLQENRFWLLLCLFPSWGTYKLLLRALWVGVGIFQTQCYHPYKHLRPFIQHSSQSVCTTITMQHRPAWRGWLINNRHLFLAVLEAGTFKIKVGPDPMSDEGQLPGSQTVIFLLCLLMAKGIKGLPGASFIRALISFMRAPPMGPNYFPVPPPPGCQDVTHKFQRDTNIQTQTQPCSIFPVLACFCQSWEYVDDLALEKPIVQRRRCSCEQIFEAE